MAKVPGLEAEDRTDRLEISETLVQHALGEILQSAPFRASKQSQQLLRYIVDQTLAGHSEQLKERLIGVNVFGRRPDYDTNEDPIVRARAAEVRKRLAQFYIGEGKRSTIRIEISPGSYLAAFSEYRSGPVPASVNPSPEQLGLEQPKLISPSLPLPSKEPESRSTSGHAQRFLTISASIVVLLCVAVGAWFLLRPGAPIDTFWEPCISGSNPVLVYSGANAVYLLSPDFVNRYKSTHHLDSLESQGLEFVVPFSPDTKLGSDDLIGYKNDYLTIGDLAANVRVASLLAAHKKRFDLRLGDDVAFGDLRQHPTVLIGAFNNSLTMELTGDLPFTVFGAKVLSIREQANPGRIWTPEYAPDGKVTVDYAVVTRIPRSKTGQALIAIAGLTQKGTQGAADFVTDPEQIQKFSVAAPKGWFQKNLQFVIQTKVVNNTATSPAIVALKTW
jgi:hypothetical protein